MRLRTIPFLSLGLALAACSSNAPLPSDKEVSGSEETPSSEPRETVSILRPEIERPAQPPSETKLGSLRIKIGFPDGGAALDADAVSALEEVLASEQFALGGPITLGAHSDSDGTDEANLDVSEERGLAVARWMIDQGVVAERITVIAFGEQNPVAPNALPDGSPNDEGRAANRRVEVEVPVPPGPDTMGESGRLIETGD